jgi:hypothetical protein
LRGIVLGARAAAYANGEPVGPLRVGHQRHRRGTSLPALTAYL